MGEPWFRRFIFPFWIYPIRWKGVRHIALSLIGSAPFGYLAVTAPDGSSRQYLYAACFIGIGIWAQVVVYSRTER